MCDNKTDFHIAVSQNCFYQKRLADCKNCIFFVIFTKTLHLLSVGFDALRNVIDEKVRREMGVPRPLLQV